MIRYAITDRSWTGADVDRWAAAGVAFVQLRDKAMEPGSFTELARALRTRLGESPRLLINGRVDVAIACQAAGMHLTSHPEELLPSQVRRVFTAAGMPPPIISVSCHTNTDMRRAKDAEVDLILFAPVFEKRVEGDLIHLGVGLSALRQACKIAANVPVLALGGVAPENISSCIEAGAAGIAGIRLFA